MSNICHSILEKLTALNIDIYHYEEIVRCYNLAKLNIERSRTPDYTDGIHSAEFDAEVAHFGFLKKRLLQNESFATAPFIIKKLLRD